ncbi:MAG: hypothetical protein WCH34_01215 [Bacteroidota bacterium]
METYIETSDSGLATQLTTFTTNVDAVSGTLGLNAGKIIQIKKDKTNFIYVNGGVDIYNKYAQSVVASKNVLRRGKDDSILVNIIPPPEWTAVSPTDMKAGVQDRFADIIQDCARSRNFTQQMGEVLGIVKPVVPFVPSDGKPNLKGHLTNGGFPILGATIGKYDGYSIYKDSGTGFKFYDKSINHDWIDHLQALPAHGTSVTWKYKLIYLYKKEEVGSFSDEISIVVYGNV